MIDSHAHILKEFYESVPKVIRRDRDKGIIAIINCADDIETSKEVISYAKKYSNFMFACVGIHPENDWQFTTKNMIELEKLVKSKYAIAVGEIGLDYHYPTANKEKQKELFEYQLKLAEFHRKPVVVHIRDAMQDAYDILCKYNVKGVIHCFNGSYEMAKKFIDRGFVLGIGGVLTFKNSNLHKLVSKLELTDILLETDSPFLTPEPLRGTRNTPVNVRYVAEQISIIKNVRFTDVTTQTAMNAARVFDLRI